MSSIPAARPRAASLSLITAGVLWGTGGLAGAVLSDRAGVSSSAVAVYRLLLGGAFALLLLACTGRLRALRTLPRTGEAARRLLAAGALLAVFQACYFGAVALTSVSVATMTTIGSVPVFVAVAVAIVDRRLPGTVTTTAIACAVLGLGLLTWSPGDVTGGGQLVGGVACALTSGAGFAALTLVNRRPVAGLDPLRTTAFGCLVGGSLLVPLAVWMPGELVGRLFEAGPDVLATALYLGAVPTALAYAAYFHGLGGSRPVVAALAALLEPLTAAVLAAVLLGDDLGVVGWCGAALLVAAVAVGSLRPATGARDVDREPVPG
ncbi:DMT family transporter [Saccharomonospora piscinae]|uniref:DMT family transporter n=1 Tax=Saccharomonospora piscinae TaxID=687388 RepID=UPI00046749C9|nr:DMT family transporter [Saccharomonospora piscinae]